MVESMFLNTYKKNGWLVDLLIYNNLSEYEKSFIDLELGNYKSLQFYKDRLSYIDFENKENVLDAGCGIGQWSIALASLNKRVNSIDLMPSRVHFASKMAENMTQKNIEFQIGSLEKLPYQDQSFDAIFCYGVFMFTHIERTLSEFQRILKKGGKLYLNFNSIGWYAHLILDRGIKKCNFRIAWQAIKMCARYFLGYKQQILIRQHWLEKKLMHHGFQNLTFASEGNLVIKNAPNAIKPKSIYQSHYYGMRSIIEVIGDK